MPIEASPANARACWKSCHAAGPRKTPKRCPAWRTCPRACIGQGVGHDHGQQRAPPPRPPALVAQRGRPSMRGGQGNPAKKNRRRTHPRRHQNRQRLVNRSRRPASRWPAPRPTHPARSTKTLRPRACPSGTRAGARACPPHNGTRSRTGNRAGQAGGRRAARRRSSRTHHRPPNQPAHARSSSTRIHGRTRSIETRDRGTADHPAGTYCDAPSPGVSRLASTSAHRVTQVGEVVHNIER